MLYLFYIFIAILVLLVMITIHEFGHYTAAKMFGFKIDEFSIGCGPAILQKRKKNREIFSVRALPLGGYCAFYSEYDDVKEEADAAESVPDNAKAVPFEKQKPYKRIIVMLAGAMFNLFSAFIFSFIYILAVGYSVPEVTELNINPSTGLPYAEGLQAGDKIVAVNDTEIGIMNSFDSLVSGVEVGTSVVLTVERGSEVLEVSVSKQYIEGQDENGNSVYNPMFGFTKRNAAVSAGVGYSLINAVPYTFKLSWAIIGSLGQMVSGQVSVSEMTGPIGTVTTIATYTEADWRYLLIFLPLIASNLAIFNLLPIPGLDGAKVVFTAIEWVRGKPLNRKIENAIHAVGMLLLFATVIIIDVIGFVSRL